jgi:TolA-binding protein
VSARARLAAALAALAVAGPAAAAPPRRACAEPLPPLPPPGEEAPPADPAALAAELRRFEEERRTWRAEARSLAEAELALRRREASLRHEAKVAPLEAEDRRRRDAVIARLEELVRRYPDDKTFTPDALFRLAELLYERGEEEWAAAMARWQEATVAAVKAGGEPPPEPAKNHAPAIALYQRLLTRFPGYKLNHAVQYLLGYCLGEMGQAAEAERAYRALVARWPASPFVPEAWMRVGDHHFEGSGAAALRRAEEAYAKVQGFPESRLLPRALYKLGWTRYRLDDYPGAVEAFGTLLDRDAALQAKGEPRGDVWPEAVQYTALSFAEGGGGVDGARAWFARKGRRPWAAEVYRALGEVLFEQTRGAEAIAAWRLALAEDPLAEGAPALHARIVAALVRDGRAEDEVAEREAIARGYADGGPWAERNRERAEALREARDLVDASLLRAATWRQARAKELARDRRAPDEYRAAAALYAEYVRRFPRARNVHELSYARADCLFAAGDFAEAALAYARLRDEPSAARWRGDAALAAVIASEREVQRQTAEGRIPARQVPVAKERGAAPLPPRAPLPDAAEALVRESDAYLARLPRGEKAPAIAYKAGELFYAWGDLEEARCRLEEVAQRWPSAEVAPLAATLVVESHLVTGDWEAMEKAAARLQGEAVAKDGALAAELQRFKLGGRFQRAMALMEARAWTDAARLFTALVAEDPAHEFADEALYNAASCLESDRRFESALKLYDRIAGEYPRSPFADEALFRVAWNAENAYDFDQAVDRYLLLVDRYPGSKRRKDALYNAARSLENLQRYDRAAEAFARYAALYPDAEDAARTQFHAARIHEKTGDWRRAAEALREFVRRFGGGREAELVVQAHLRVGLAEAELRNAAAARAAWEEATAEFARRGLKPEAHPRAAAAAAEARFRLAEIEFARYDAIALPATTSPKKLQAALEAKLGELKRVAPLYNEVKRYKRPEWTLAAFYRQAFLLERLAQTLYEAPVPPELQKAGQEEYLAAYQDQLAQFAQPYEDQAVAVYVQALAAARELHVKNEWTRKVAESLARYRPREYPILKDPRGRMLHDDVSPAALAGSPLGAGPPAAAPAPAAAPPAVAAPPPVAATGAPRKEAP